MLRHEIMEKPVKTHQFLTIIKGASDMRDRALRRHQDFKAKRKNQKNYNSCISGLPASETTGIENNVEKLKKVCVMGNLDKHSRKENSKPLRELKHDITMKEQLYTA